MIDCLYYFTKLKAIRLSFCCEIYNDCYEVKMRILLMLFVIFQDEYHTGFGSQDPSACSTHQAWHIYHTHTLPPSFWHSLRRLWNHPVDETWPGWCELPHTRLRAVHCLSLLCSGSSWQRASRLPGGGDSPSVDVILQYSCCSEA